MIPINSEIFMLYEQLASVSHSWGYPYFLLSAEKLTTSGKSTLRQYFEYKDTLYSLQKKLLEFERRYKKKHTISSRYQLLFWVYKMEAQKRGMLWSR